VEVNVKKPLRQTGIREKNIPQENSLRGLGTTELLQDYCHIPYLVVKGLTFKEAAELSSAHGLHAKEFYQNYLFHNDFNYPFKSSHIDLFIAALAVSRIHTETQMLQTEQNVMRLSLERNMNTGEFSSPQSILLQKLEKPLLTSFLSLSALAQLVVHESGINISPSMDMLHISKSEAHAIISHLKGESHHRKLKLGQD